MVKVTKGEGDGMVVDQVYYLTALGLLVELLGKGCHFSINRSGGIFCFIECFLRGERVTFSGISSHLQSLVTLHLLFTELLAGGGDGTSKEAQSARAIMEKALGGGEYSIHECLTMALLLAVGMSREEDLNAGLLTYGRYGDIIAAVELTHEGACSFAEAIALAA